MKKTNSDLIHELVKDYGPRPWWKKPRTLVSLWFAFHLAYFVALGFLKFDALVLRSSRVYVGLAVFGAIVTSGLFIYLSRQQQVSRTTMRMISFLALAWMGAAFLGEDLFAGTVLHGRPLGVTAGDFSCFWHATLSTIGPVLIFPVLFRAFFFARPRLALVTMSCHLAILATTLNELKCPDRQLWHLVWGHQTIPIGVGLLLLAVTLFAQRRASLALSKIEKR